MALAARTIAQGVKYPDLLKNELFLQGEIMSTRICDFIKQLIHANIDHTKSNFFIKKRNAAQKKRGKIYKKYLEGLDNQINKMQEDISKICTHPNCEVEIKPWSSDDGEGNSWSGTYFTLICPDCSFKKRYDRRNENNKYEWWEETGLFLDKKEKSYALNVLQQKINEEARIERKKIEKEEDAKRELRLYSALKKKYEGKKS